jgi:methanogenic corrinoid protein MtbC1
MMSSHEIRTRLDEFAAAVADRHFAAHAEVLARYPAAGRQRCLEDARFHLQYLATALEAENEEMFLDYVAWTKVLLAKRNVPAADLADNFAILADVLAHHDDAVRFVRGAIAALPSMSDDVPPLLDPRAPHWPVASEYLAALLRGSRSGAFEIVSKAIDDGVPIRDIYRRVFEPVQHEIGRLWQLNQITVAQEHFCTAATQHIMTRLYSHMFVGQKQDRRAVAMCVGRELHEIGLRIITDLLELEGWQTWYLGASVPPAAAVQLCVEQKADVLLVSATLPPHIATVEEVVRLFHTREELAHAKVVVGGRAFRTARQLWRTIGADGYAANADECLALLDQLTNA